MTSRRDFIKFVRTLAQIGKFQPTVIRRIFSKKSIKNSEKSYLPSALSLLTAQIKINKKVLFFSYFCGFLLEIEWQDSWKWQKITGKLSKDPQKCNS
jgi:hypothetical protein